MQLRVLKNKTQVLSDSRTVRVIKKQSNKCPLKVRAGEDSEPQTYEANHNISYSELQK